MTLNERDIPAELLPKARAWFAQEMARLEKLHGDKWPDHRDWLAEYVSEELRERAMHRTAA
jgi:hypothetical protein